MTNADSEAYTQKCKIVYEGYKQVCLTHKTDNLQICNKGLSKEKEAMHDELHRQLSYWHDAKGVIRECKFCTEEEKECICNDELGKCSYHELNSEEDTQ